MQEAKFIPSPHDFRSAPTGKRVVNRASLAPSTAIREMLRRLLQPEQFTSPECLRPKRAEPEQTNQTTPSGAFTKLQRC